MEHITDSLRLFSDWISYSDNFTKLFLVPVVTSIIANFIYDIFKKGEVLAAEEFINNSLRNFIKEDKIPSPNYIETLIKTTAEKYKIDIADLPMTSSLINNLIKEIMNNPLNDVDRKNRILYQLEWLKQRCQKPCYWKLQKHIEKWIGRLLWTIVFALTWYFIIIMPFEHLNFTPNFVFAVTMVLFFLFIELGIASFLINDQRTEDIEYEEIVKAWERYKEKGIKNAKNEKYESAAKYFYQAIETYPAKRTEEYDCIDSSPYMKRDSKNLDEERIDEALDLGELYILFGENLMNLGEKRYDEAIYYFKKGLNIFDKRVQSVYVFNSKKRNEQIENIMNASIPFVVNFAKIDNQKEFEEVVKRTKKFACLCQYDYFDKLKEKLKDNAKYTDLLDQIRNS